MLTNVRNGKSLTFYNRKEISDISGLQDNFSGTTGAIISDVSSHTATISNGYNAELNTYLSRLNELRIIDLQQLDLSSPNRVARSTGVKRAWMYEKADIEMGGKGSANWSASEQTQIKENGTVYGAEGHHQQNVADHPDQQANPDNIKFYKTKQQHLIEGHGGRWDNESNKPKIDKNKMLKKTNTKRLAKNELHGLGLAMAIGAGVGLTIGFITTLAQSGVTPDSLKFAAIEGVKSSIESGMLSAVSYTAGRTVGEVATQAIAGTLQNAGLNITENILKMVNMGVVGTLTITIFAVYQFAKLKRSGVTSRETLMRVGKQALFSLSLLAVSIAAQGVWGGPAGIIVSVSIGIILISYSTISSMHQRNFSELVRVYTIEKYRPLISI